MRDAGCCILEWAAWWFCFTMENGGWICSKWSNSNFFENGMKTFFSFIYLFSLNGFECVNGGMIWMIVDGPVSRGNFNGMNYVNGVDFFFFWYDVMRMEFEFCMIFFCGCNWSAVWMLQFDVWMWQSVRCIELNWCEFLNTEYALTRRY